VVKKELQEAGVEPVFNPNYRRLEAMADDLP
jgi:hypothetical protein